MLLRDNIFGPFMSMMAVMVHIRIELASLGFTVHGYRAISFELWRDFSKEERNCNKANILNSIEN